MRVAAKNKSALQKRIKRFIESLDNECKVFFDRLKDAGDAAIYGGLVRDFCIGGAANFKSDIDIVVDIPDSKLTNLIVHYNYQRNKFGGYRLEINKRKIDVWSLDSTWAIKAGLVSESGLNALLSATFFDWDAALFKLNDNSLISAANYVEKIKDRKLSLNLQENPNPLGSTVRALRFVKKCGARLDPSLATFILDRIEEEGPSRICQYESHSYGKVYISESFVRDTKSKIKNALPFDNFLELDSTPKQLSFLN